MVRVQKQGLILIPRPHNHRYKTTLGGTTITDDSFKFSWNKPITDGVGKFTLILNNNRKNYSDSFNVEDTFCVYIDWGVSPTTKVFEGQAETIEKKFDTTYGHTLKIKGEHVTGLLTGILVTANFSNTPAYTAVNQLINSKAPSGFTSNNVETTGNASTTITKTFDETPFWEAMEEICKLSGCDIYVDDDKDFHFFEENSKTCTRDIVNFEDNLIKVHGIGKDNADKVDQSRVYGKDENDLPIIYTSGSGNRQTVAKEDAVSSITEASELANADLNDAETERGSAECLGMTYVNPGDKIWVSYPPQAIQSQFKVYNIKNVIDKGKFTTDLELENPTKNISWLVRENIKKTVKREDIDNPNEMEYSFNEEFKDNNGTHSNTEESNGQLKLQAGQSSGTWTSETHSANTAPSHVELRLVGQDLLSSTISVSVDGGATYEEVDENDLHSVVGSGSSVIVKFELTSDTDNPQPLVKSFALLYK